MGAIGGVEVSKYDCTKPRYSPEGPLTCGKCRACKAVKAIAFEVWEKGGGVDLIALSIDAAALTGRPAERIRGLMKDFRRVGKPPGFDESPPPKREAAMQLPPDAEMGVSATCRCGLRLPCNGCLPTSAADMNIQGSSMAEFAGAVKW